MANRLLKGSFLQRHKIVSGVEGLLHFVFDFFAGHALPCLQQSHILFKTRNIQLQRFKGHRQGLIAKIEILSGILGIVEQLMRRRTQRK